MGNASINGNEIKISFLGDIMCEKPLLKAFHKKGNKVFTDLFKDTDKLLSKSDYVVGNLETVFAGENAGYTEELYSFNTPDQFLDALVQSQISLCLTANNHCLDRGKEGLVRTIDQLDKRNIEHIGTYRTLKDSKKILVKNFNGTKVGFLAFTYGTGIKDNKVELDESDQFMVDLLMPQKVGSPVIYKKTVKQGKSLKTRLFSHLSEENKLKIRNALNMKVNTVRQDMMSDDFLDQNILNQIKSSIQAAKEQCDFLIVNLHNGGQFNAEPGLFAEYMAQFTADCGADLIIGHHPHVVQEFTVLNTENKLVPCFFSLGNFSISPSSPYLLFEDLPEYAVIPHVYLNNNKLDRITYSIIKICENKDHSIRVLNTYDLEKTEKDKKKEQLIRDINQIQNRLSGRTENSISSEYEIWSMML